jgi:type II secretory pathway component PulF
MNRLLRVIFVTLLICVPLAWLGYTIAIGSAPVFSSHWTPDFIGPVSAVFAGMGLITLVVLLILAGVSRRALRQRRVSVVLTYLEQAVRLNVPLTSLLIAAESSEPRSITRRLGRLRRALDGGASVAEALRDSLREISPRALALIAIAERVGRLPDALDRLVREDHARRIQDPAEQSFYAAYPVLMVMAILFIVGTVLLFVMPKFVVIFRDFHVALPGVTQLVIAIANVAGQGGWVALLLLLVWLVTSAIRDRYWPGRPWNWAWFTGHRDLADVCRVIADSLDAGLPLDAAVRSAGELAVSSSLRWKLYRWVGGIEQGMPATDAARRAGLPSLIAGLTSTAQVAGARDVFRFLARYYGGRFSRFVQLLRGAAIPAMVFFFGILVAFIALALFLPLISLIGAASPYRVSL